LKASAGLAHYSSDKAEADAYTGARNALIPAQSLPMSSRIVARHLRKPVSVDMFLEKPVFNQHFYEPAPVTFSVPMSVEDFAAWRDENSAGTRAVAPSSSAAPAVDVPAASKSKKKEKKDKTQNGTTRKTKRSKASSATPAGDAPPPPLDAPVPPPPPGPAPPPPI
jgi:hypothetical protein